MSGKRYPEEFKTEAVKQVVDRGYSVASVATRLDITTHLSYPRNMDTGLSEVLVFKLFRTEAATPTVPPPPIVITFDIIKHRCPHYFPADKVFSMDTFHFQRMKEAFHAGIIVAATFCAHTSTQIMPLQLRLIIC